MHLCYYTCSCSGSVAAVGQQVQYGPQTEGRISQRVSGLSHDSMCGSWFSFVLKCVWCGLGLVSLFFFIIFLFEFIYFWTCTLVLLLLVPLVCLSVHFELLFWDFYVPLQVLPQMLKTHKALTPLCPHASLSLTRSLCPPHTPTHSTTPKTSPQTLSPPTTPSLCSAASVPPHLLTDFLVFLQSRKASEQAKSVDSKTDSIGSGRAIPIKQVSSSIIIPLYLISCYMGEYNPVAWVCSILFHALWNKQRSLFKSTSCVSMTTRWQHGTKMRPVLCDGERGGH